MFEKIYLKDSNLRPHLDAPFLKEREDFVSRMVGRGYCVRYQQMVASYLLFAVKYLGLKDNDRSPVALMPIWEMGQAYRQKRLASKRRKNSSPDVDTKYVDQIHYTITWLKEIGMLDEQYNDIAANIARGVNTYWLSRPLRTGVGQKHTAYFEGGSQEMRYSASLMYNNVAGVMKKSDRSTISGNIIFSYRYFYQKSDK